MTNPILLFWLHLYGLINPTLWTRRILLRSHSTSSRWKLLFPIGTKQITLGGADSKFQQLFNRHTSNSNWFHYFLQFFIAIKSLNEKMEELFCFIKNHLIRWYLSQLDFHYELLLKPSQITFDKIHWWNSHFSIRGNFTGFVWITNPIRGDLVDFL